MSHHTKTLDGNYRGIAPISTIPRNEKIEVRRGNQPDYLECFSIYGERGRHAAFTPADGIVDLAPFDLTRLTTAETMDVVSTDGNDDAVGTGARTVFIKGVNGDYNEVTEYVQLDGLTPVTTSESYLVIHQAIVLSCGSNGSNIGTINITASTAATTQAQIYPGIGITEQAWYLVPQDRALYIIGSNYYADRDPGGDTAVTFTLGTHSNVLEGSGLPEGETYVEGFRTIVDSGSSGAVEKSDIIARFGPKTFIINTVETQNNDTVARASYLCYLCKS